MAHFGYAGSILRVDLSSGKTESIPTAAYAERFVGGRGIAAKVCWDEVPPETKAFDPENRLVFATGPLACVPVIGGSRWEVCGKSPITSPHHFNYCNLGGRWGADLKFAGYDALIVQGKADNPVYVLISENRIELKDANFIWGTGAIETREKLKSECGNSARVVAIGPAGENGAVMASLLADNDSSGTGGLGAVMGSKNLKAIVVLNAGKRVEIAEPENLKELTQYYRSLKRIAIRFPPELAQTRSPMAPPHKIKKPDVCYGCVGCYRMLYQAEDGQTGKFMCNAGMFYQHWASQHGGDWMDVAFHATKLADTYGLDTKAIDKIVCWLHNCYEAGILTEHDIGLPLSRIGTLEFMQALVKMISFREGFGDLLAAGLDRAAASIGPLATEELKHIGYVGLPEFTDVYSPQLYTPHAIFYAMEPRLSMAQFHEIGATIPKWASWAQGNPKGLSSSSLRALAGRFWGSELAVDFSTYDDKALAAKMIQDREYIKASLILCDNIWPIIETKYTDNNMGDPTLESKVLSAVTGHEYTEQYLYEIGERIFNLQRAILVREGHRGRIDDTLAERFFTEPLKLDFLNPECLVPGKDGEVISRKVMTVDRDGFEKMKDEYYELRGWDVATGLQIQQQLDSLGLPEVAEDLRHRNLLG